MGGGVSTRRSVVRSLLQARTSTVDVLFIADGSRCVGMPCSIGIAGCRVSGCNRVRLSKSGRDGQLTLPHPQAQFVRFLPAWASAFVLSSQRNRR